MYQEIAHPIPSPQKINGPSPKAISKDNPMGPHQTETKLVDVLANVRKLLKQGTELMRRDRIITLEFTF